MSEKSFCISCPHCNENILIEQLNCRIFRHGVLKSTNQQINPHGSKQESDKFLAQNAIYGCGQPFKIITENDVHRSEKCEWI
jgi:hypothetical protein